MPAEATRSGVTVPKEFIEDDNPDEGVMSDGGSLVFMSSVAAITGTSGLSLYSACKGAIESMTRSLAVELSSK